jgi:predicted metal-dependent HD superfamily phosphohydrolase
MAATAGNNPATNARTVNRDSTRRNRTAIRSVTCSNSGHHRPTATLHAAAVVDIDLSTTFDHLTTAALHASPQPVTPSYAEVLEVRAGRVAMVRDFLATVMSEVLAATRRNPHAPEYQETVLSCLHVILYEEWEHYRYAVRDLDAIEAKSDA